MDVLEEINFPSKAVDYCLQYVIHIWKAMPHFSGSVFVHLVMRQIFTNAVKLNCNTELTRCLIKDGDRHRNVLIVA